MAVLVEALSVIIRLAAIEHVYEDGWSSFVELVPSQMLCADDDLARVGFMLPDAVGDFLEKLKVLVVITIASSVIWLVSAVFVMVNG